MTFYNLDKQMVDRCILTLYNKNMITVDKLLLKIISHNSPSIDEYMSAKDARLIRSLGVTLNNHNFFTENQGKLLIKILLPHVIQLNTIDSDSFEILNRAVWSKPFKIVDQIRKVYLQTTVSGETGIFIEFSFSSNVRKILNNIVSSLQGGVQTLSTKLVAVELTEKNIITLLDALKPLKFEIDSKIQDFYEIIKKWDLSQECRQLMYGEDLHQSIKQSLKTEFDLSDSNVQNLILDRSLRYQFFVKKTEKNQENLENLITHRTQSKVWIDSAKHTLTDVFKILQDLHRLPTLVVFDSWQGENCVKNLKNLGKSLKENNILDSVGIYFRLPSDATGKEFNTFIGENRYNAKLDSSTVVAGVQAGKLPKFFLKDCSWQPKSVIVLDSSLRHSKTAVYSNRCDLIISYSDKASIFDSQTSWATSTWAL